MNELSCQAKPISVLMERYRTLHQQGFVPICVPDRFDAVQLAEAAVAAGAKVVEITCRRATACEDFRRVRAAMPDLVVLAGSVIDDGPMARFLHARWPEVPSIARLCDLGVDGFVSAWPLALETIARLSSTHLVIPGVETVQEAVRAVEAGAHFAKLFTIHGLQEHRRVALVTSGPLYGLLPIFVTGGVTLAKIEPYVESRAALLGAGWEVILGDRFQAVEENPSTDELAAALRRHLVAMAEARSKHDPKLGGQSVRQYIGSIRHYHPFLEWTES